MPSLTELNVLLLLLLPGFVSYKIRRSFLPQIPSNKPDSFDKIAVYFLLTLFTYCVAVPIFFWLNLTSFDKPEVVINFVIVATIALLLGLISSIVHIIFFSSSSTKRFREFLYKYISLNGSLWYKVFSIDLRESEIALKERLIVEVTIYTTEGEVFIGELYSYPIEDNIENSKDFVLKGVTQVYANGSIRTFPSDFGLLLNQRDILKIIYHYASKNDKIRLANTMKTNKKKKGRINMFSPIFLKSTKVKYSK